MTKYPGDNPSNKGKKWNVKQLQSIPISWAGHTISDGGGLNGDIKLSKDGNISVSFKYSFRFEGKLRKFYCGTFPTSSLESIRIKRDQARNCVRQKIDPKIYQEALILEQQKKIDDLLKAEEEDRRRNFTVQDLFNEWIELGVNRSNQNKTLKSMFNNNLLPKIGNIKLKDLTEQNLIDALKEIADKKQTTAFEQAKDFRQMMKWGEKREPWRNIIIQNNPAELVTFHNFLPRDFEKKRRRTLKENEIIKFSQKIEQLNLKYKNQWNADTYLKLELVFWICLSTACRIGELSKAEWDHLNFEDRTWFIPLENSKGITGKKTDHTIYLSDFSLQKFKILHTLTGDQKWMLPSNVDSQHVSENYYSKLIGDRQINFKNRNKKLMNRIENNDLVIGNEKWTAHDLRRTAATKIQSFFNIAEGRLIAKLCLHHKTLYGAESHYLFHEYKNEMQEGWAKLGTYLEKLAKP